MIRDCAGLEDSDDDSELESAGPGDSVSSSSRNCLAVRIVAAVGVVGMPSDESRLRGGSRGCRGVFAPVLRCGAGPMLPGPVPPGDVRVAGCFAKGALPAVVVEPATDTGSLLGVWTSLRIERDEGARACPRAAPAPDPVLLMSDAVTAAKSDGGTGDGAADPLAAVSFRICARTWAAWRSVRYVTCWRRKSTVTSNSTALECTASSQSQSLCTHHIAKSISA